MCTGKVIEQNSMGVRNPVNICTSLYIIYVQNQHDMISLLVAFHNHSHDFRPTQ